MRDLDEWNTSKYTDKIASKTMHFSKLVDFKSS